MTSDFKLPEMFQKIAQDAFPSENEDTATPTPESTAQPVPLAPSMSAQLDQANEAIAALAKEYPNWASQDVIKMTQMWNDARSISGQQREDLVRKELFRIAHNAKGQGATFGYPLITEIGEHLCRYIERVPEMDTDTLNIIRDHINAMDTVLKEKLTGNGGEKGQELLHQILNT